MEEEDEEEKMRRLIDEYLKTNEVTYIPSSSLDEVKREIPDFRPGEIFGVMKF